MRGSTAFGYQIHHNISKWSRKAGRLEPHFLGLDKQGDVIENSERGPVTPTSSPVK